MTALIEAELEWTRKLVGEMKSKSLEGMELWQDFHGLGPEKGNAP
jgi:hypothetical protein